MARAEEEGMSTTKLSLETASFRDLVAVAEAMLPEIAEAADEIDDARRLPGWLADRLAAAGFFHLLTGREHGGMEADPVTAARVIEMLSTASPSVGWVTMILAAASFWAVRMVPEQVRREIFADVKPGEIQPTVVAGTLVPHGRAVRADGGWRLSGQWPFASGCHHATWLPTAAWLYDEDGPIRDDDGAPQWRVFHLPASDCAILDTWYTSGLRGTGSTDYTMEDVFVADSYVKRHSLLEPPRLPDRRYAYPGFTVPMLSAVALGAARGAVDSLVELFGGKIDRRNQRPVASALDKQADLGVAAATVDSARAYLYDTTARAWELIMAGEELPRQLRAGMRLACTHAVTASVQAVDRAHSAAGASSIYSASPLDRYFRDVHSVAAHAFVRQTTMADGGQLLLGQEPAFRVF
jgi:alkylation response protein AidB-like acyl-CoA dehydrogenase